MFPVHSENMSASDNSIQQSISPQKIKAGILMPLGDQRGGGEKNLWDLISEGRQGPIQWVVIFQQDGPLVQQIKDMGVSTHVVPSGRLRNIPNTISAILKIASIIRQEKLDTIIAWMWSAHIYSSPAGCLAGCPAILSQVEAPDDYWFKRLVTRIFPSRGILINSQDGLERLKRMMPGASGKMRLVYPGADLSRFDPEVLPSAEEIREKLGLGKEGPVIGLVGRLQRWKGPHVLVESMPKIRKHFPGARCVIVGGRHDLEGDYEDYLKNQIKELGLDDCVILAGLQRNIPEWMQAMDIVVHASDNEPFGLVIIEAMALGKPMVATNMGGPTEIMTDGTHGILTPYGDSVALADAILEYLKDPQMAAAIGSAAQKRADDFSTRRYADNFINAIVDLVRQR